MTALENLISNGTSILQGLYVFIFIALLVFFLAKQKKIALFATIIVGAIVGVFVFDARIAIDALKDGIIEFFQ